MISLIVTEEVRSIFTKSSEVALFSDNYASYLKGYSDVVVYCILGNDSDQVSNIKFNVPDLLKNIEIGSTLEIDEVNIRCGFISVIGVQIQPYTKSSEDDTLLFSLKSKDNNLLLKCNGACYKMPGYSGIRFYNDKALFYTTTALVTCDTDYKDIDELIDKDVARSYLRDATIKRKDAIVCITTPTTCLMIPHYKTSSVSDHVINQQYETIGDFELSSFSRELCELIKKPSLSMMQFKGNEVYPVIRDTTNVIGNFIEHDLALSIPPVIIQLIYKLFDKFTLSCNKNVYRLTDNKLNMYIGATKC